MDISLPKEIIDLLEDKNTVKLLATVDQDGHPHLVVKQTIRADDQGNLIYFELLESSKTNKNLVRSIWFNGVASIALANINGQSYQIKCKPVKSIVNGPQFRRYYIEAQKELGDVDLAAVWVLQPESVVDQTYPSRRSEEERIHPYFNHLDRLAK